MSHEMKIVFKTNDSYFISLILLPYVVWLHEVHVKEFITNELPFEDIIFELLLECKSLRCVLHL